MSYSSTPFETAWSWWVNLLPIPLWNPWLAILALAVLFVVILQGVRKMLSP